MSKDPKTFAIYWHYLTEDVTDGVDFLHASKYKSFLQDKSIIFDWYGQSCPKYPNWFAISLQFLQKEVRDEIGFLHAEKHQSVLYKLIN